MKIFKKIKNIIKRIKRRIDYDICYNKQERIGIAIFEMCGKWIDERCKKCPYRVAIRGDENV